MMEIRSKSETKFGSERLDLNKLSLTKNKCKNIQIIQSKFFLFKNLGII